MSDTLPAWFATDQVHDSGDGWYIGAADGFRLGPFRSRRQAEDQSRALSAALTGCDSTSERIRRIRRFIIEQRLEHGRRLHGSGAAQSAAAEGSLPEAAPRAVRAGERRRVWFRTHRVFAADNAWFFATREGLDLGPYPSREAARLEAARLQALLRTAPDEDAARQIVLDFAARHGRDDPGNAR